MQSHLIVVLLSVLVKRGGNCVARSLRWRLNLHVQSLNENKKAGGWYV